MKMKRKRDHQKKAGLKPKSPVFLTKAQSSLEYLITVGFVTLLVTSVILIAYFYTGIFQDKIKNNQINAFAGKLISSAESIFYAGEPSKTSLELYLPAGVNNITVSGTTLIVNYTTGATQSVRAFDSRVNITGAINRSPGVKRLTLEAKSDHVEISS